MKIDSTAPSISGGATSLPNGNGWWNGSVVVHFVGSDGLSGVASVTPDVTVSTEGLNQAVTGTVVDQAGNSASLTVGAINIDLTAPTVSAVRTPANGAGWNNGSVTVTFSGADGLSGVGLVTSPVTLSSQGAGQSVVGYVVDKAGNRVSLTVGAINIDLTAPTVSAVRTPANSAGWNNGSVTVTFIAGDSLSGVASAVGNTTLTGEGAGQTATGRVVDVAGNSAVLTVTGINIDKTAPVISGAPTTAANGAGWWKTDVTVHFTASDVWFWSGFCYC